MSISTSPRDRQKNTASSGPQSSSFTQPQRVPARSYVPNSNSYQSHAIPIEGPRYRLKEVRNDTADLASYGRSEVDRPERFSGGLLQVARAASGAESSNATTVYDHDGEGHESYTPFSAVLIDEASERLLGEDRPASTNRPSPGINVQRSSEDDCSHGLTPRQPLNDNSRSTNGKGKTIQTIDEYSPLLSKPVAYGINDTHYHSSPQDLEHQRQDPSWRSLAFRRKVFLPFRNLGKLGDCFEDYRQLSKGSQKRWVTTALRAIAPLIIGLLMNILDALSYGRIIFPLAEPVFADLAPVGISMFYVSTVVSQLVYSLGASGFQAGVGSEMIEVIPFFHQMAFKILGEVGRDKPDVVRSTTFIAFIMSSVVTGITFLLMSRFRLGELIGFFPHHVLTGCIGGIGLFLLQTGLDVSARLNGNLHPDLGTIEKLFAKDTLPRWLIPLALMLTLFLIKWWCHSAFVDASFYCGLLLVFHITVAAIPNEQLDDLQRSGWVFQGPQIDKPWYSLYSLYNFRNVSWVALAKTLPIMLALDFFSLLHVPINVPALAASLKKDDLDMDRELRAHGISNAVSGLLGSVQNYMVYTNSLVFIKSGAKSRFSGVLLAGATLLILFIFSSIIRFIPIFVVSTLIFTLGFELLKEALVDTWSHLNIVEYITILFIVVVIAVWDFTAGIVVGILIACVINVVQSSRTSAIRGIYSGKVATSTVRRNPIQQRYLEQAGQQTRLVRLSGILFFGTIAAVEKEIRSLLDQSFKSEPIRYLVFDLSQVDGVDNSTNEAFMRMIRMLKDRCVLLCFCGVSLDGKVGRALKVGGVLGEGIDYFETLNSALEYCENGLLKAFYEHEALANDDEAESTPQFLNVPSDRHIPDKFANIGSIYGSPRRDHLHHIATTTLAELSPTPTSHGAEAHPQPLRIMLEVFRHVSAQPSDFWSKVAPFFSKETFPAGTALYHPGERASAFYILASGILKAEYDMEQGKYIETIVEGTTCGELPFFSDTARTSTTTAERESTCWILTRDSWESIQAEHSDVARELLKVALALTKERMDNNIQHVLLQRG